MSLENNENLEIPNKKGIFLKKKWSCWTEFSKSTVFGINIRVNQKLQNAISWNFPQAIAVVILRFQELNGKFSDREQKGVRNSNDTYLFPAPRNSFFEFNILSTFSFSLRDISDRNDRLLSYPSLLELLLETSIFKLIGFLDFWIVEDWPHTSTTSWSPLWNPPCLGVSTCWVKSGSTYSPLQFSKYLSSDPCNSLSLWYSSFPI